MYVTACVGMLDVSGRSLEVSNAGHPPVYHLSGRTGSLAELGTPGFPLGWRPDREYKEKKVKVEVGDVLVFYTDGTYEARDGEGRLYGFERLERLIGGLDPGMSAQEWITRIVEDVEQFAGVSQHEDDMTLVVVKVGA